MYTLHKHLSGFKKKGSMQNFLSEQLGKLQPNTNYAPPPPPHPLAPHPTPEQELERETRQQGV